MLKTVYLIERYGLRLTMELLAQVIAVGRKLVQAQQLSGREQLLSLHATIKSVFHATTTDHARGAWA